MAYKDKAKQREYQRKWMERRRAEFFNDKECKICGSVENLELHHRDPSQKESHSIWSWAPERRNVEITKCDVLCHDCHIHEHRPIRHGTIHMYRAYKCRCNPCRATNTERSRAYRRKKHANKT